MTVIAPSPDLRATRRVARPRRYLMCPPEYFTVGYSINPWMDVDCTVDIARAHEQWVRLRQIYADLGHVVEVIAPEPGLPDMVFAANGGLVIGGRALGAHFSYAQRRGEAPAYLRWFAKAGLAQVTQPVHVNEGEGDFIVVGDRVLAGTGFRTDPEAHSEVQELFGGPVISLRLVDPRYYHLDTALTALDDGNIAYFPAAFSPGSQQVLASLFPDAVVADAQDAAVLGLNAVSDGRNVILAQRATGLLAQLAERGYNPIGVDLSEMLKAGGGPKCCTLEIRA